MRASPHATRTRDLQLDAGCEKIFSEQRAGAQRNRPELARAPAGYRPGKRGPVQQNGRPWSGKDGSDVLTGSGGATQVVIAAARAASLGGVAQRPAVFFSQVTPVALAGSGRPRVLKTVISMIAG